MRYGSQYLPLLVAASLVCSFLPASYAEAKESDHNPSRSWHLKVQSGRLTVVADRVPLHKIMSELARQVPVAIAMKGAVGEEPVAVRFKGVPLEEGIKKILQGREYAIIHARLHAEQDLSGAARIREILVLSKPGSSGAQDQWLDLSDPDSIPVPDLQRRALESPDAGDRAVALEQLMNRGEDDEIMPVLTRALRDKDSGVRELALESLEDTVAPLPVETVAEIALSDRNPKLRARALTLLTFRAEDEAAATLETALEDQDIRVRQMAAELLDELELIQLDEKERQAANE